jgi:hypothetical protein
MRFCFMKTPWPGGIPDLERVVVAESFAIWRMTR